MNRTTKVFLTALNTLIGSFLLVALGNWCFEPIRNLLWDLSNQTQGGLVAFGLGLLGSILCAGFITFWVWIYLRIWIKKDSLT